MVVIFFPEQFLFLAKLKFLPGLFQVVYKHSTFIDQYIDDLPELFGVGLAEVGE